MIAPIFSMQKHRQQVAEAAEIPGAWLSLEKAAKVLGELLGELGDLGDGSLLAAGRDLLAPRAAMLMEEHLVRRGWS